MYVDPSGYKGSKSKCATGEDQDGSNQKKGNNQKQDGAESSSDKKSSNNSSNSSKKGSQVESSGNTNGGGSETNDRNSHTQHNTTVPTDIYVFGNNTKPSDARSNKDFGVESGSDVISAQSPPLPKGKSVCSDPYETPLTGTIYKVPEGTPLPDGLAIVYDGKDKVLGGHAKGHYTIYPSTDMTVDEFNALYQSMPWEKGGKKK